MGDEKQRFHPITYHLSPITMNYFNYFTEIEDTFVRRRGKTLLLSPVDWALIENWKEKGVPLHVALRGIEKSFDSYESRPRSRSVKTLLYCQEEVEAQFDEWLEAQRGASIPKDEDEKSKGKRARKGRTKEAKEEVDLPFPREAITRHLADGRAALERAQANNGNKSAGELDEALTRAAARLAELEADFNGAKRPNAEKLEDALTDLEAILNRALLTVTPPGALVWARAEAEAQLKPYKQRMEREAYEQTRDNLLLKRLREARGVPRLSLFYL